MKKYNPYTYLIIGLIVFVAAFSTMLDLWKIHKTGVEVRGTVVEYAPQKAHGKIEHNYFVDTKFGRILKKLSHEKVDIGSEVVFIIPDGPSYFDDYDMSKKDSFGEFILQDGWWILIIGMFLFGSMMVVVGAVEIKADGKQKL